VSVGLNGFSAPGSFTAPSTPPGFGTLTPPGGFPRPVGPSGPATFGAPSTVTSPGEFARPGGPNAPTDPNAPGALGAPGNNGRPGRRDPAALYSPNQRVTEPPAGLGPMHYPVPILPPIAGQGGARGGWLGQSRRWWVVAAVAIIALAALGIAGTALLTHRFAARSDGLAVKARDLSYLVPADWRLTPGGPETSVDGVALDGVATGARYVCGGHGRYRATVGSTFLVRRDGVDARPEDAARDFGPLFATSFYGAGAVTNATAPAPLSVGNLTGSTSLVTVRPAAAAGCPDLTGRLTVVALPTSRKGAAGGTGVLLLIVAHDASGGPASPAPIDPKVVSEILSSVRVTDH
jgi:hypothetical protein